jgi:hypothetical protein
MTEAEKKYLMDLIPYSTIHQIFKYAEMNNFDIDVVFSLISQVSIDYVLDHKLGIKLVQPKENTIKS